jgi:hypothetical protein
MMGRILVEVVAEGLMVRWVEVWVVRWVEVWVVRWVEVWLVEVWIVEVWMEVVEIIVWPMGVEGWR